MRFPRCPIVALTLGLSLAFSAMAHEYKAPIDNSQWKTTTSKLECTLTHTIPGFGKATFSQSSNQHQHLVVESILDRLKPGKAKIISYPQHWKYDNSAKKIGQIPVRTGTQPMVVDDLPVYQLLESLEMGQSPAFIVTPANTAFKGQTHHKDKIVLMPMGFQKAYKEYLNCIAQMVPHTFAELKETVLHFESGSAILSPQEESKLKELATFIRADGKIRKVTIEGHSDSKGTFQANNYLANQRMWAVKDFMVQFHGIDPNRFTMKDLADKVPVASNKTQEGRAKNRRVVIKLYR